MTLRRLRWALAIGAVIVEAVLFVAWRLLIRRGDARLPGEEA